MTKATMTGIVLTAAVLDVLANWLAAHYLISVGWLIFPAGTLAFALSFTLYDALRRFGGLGPTLTAVSLGFACSVAAGLWVGGGITRIAVAGVIALACSSLTDLAAQSVTLRLPIWRYVLTSNALSLFVDSLVFVGIAFAALPTDVRLRLVVGQYAAKIAMSVLSIPLVYLARHRLRAPGPGADSRRDTGARLA
jgi:uncharacterized PurR-regulated membrane protein YhhQ (DUF165 family)